MRRTRFLKSCFRNYRHTYLFDKTCLSYLYLLFLRRKFVLNEIRNVERKTDKEKGERYLIELELVDLKNNRSVMLSEYVFMLSGTKQLCYPKHFQWNRTVDVYLIVTAKNLGRWVHHFIKNVEKILKETKDSNLHVIIYDYNSLDINLEKVLRESSLTRYMFLRETGEYSRTQSFTEAINLVSDPHSIIVMLDLHLDVETPFINNIRKVSLLEYASILLCFYQIIF